MLVAIGSTYEVRTLGQCASLFVKAKLGQFDCVVTWVFKLSI